MDNEQLLLSIYNMMDKIISDKLNPICSQLKDMGEQLDALKNRFDTLEARFDNLEARFDTLEARFDNLEARFDNLEARFCRMEDRMDAFELRQNKMAQQITQLQLTQKTFEVNASKKIARLQDGMDTIVEILKINKLIPVSSF